MIVQLPLMNLQTKEIGFFRTPQEISTSWNHLRYASTAILNDTMFIFGSVSAVHQRDIAIVRNCGIEMYFQNGKQIKFAGKDYFNLSGTVFLPFGITGVFAIPDSPRTMICDM